MTTNPAVKMTLIKYMIDNSKTIAYYIRQVFVLFYLQANREWLVIFKLVHKCEIIECNCLPLSNLEELLSYNYVSF